MNSFLFVRFSQVQKLLSNVKRWLKKYTSTAAFLSCERHTAAALSILCYSLRGAFVSVVSAFRVHFLTLIDNYPISQRANTSRTCFRRFRVRGVQFAAFVSVVSQSVSVFGGKVITL